MHLYESIGIDCDGVLADLLSHCATQISAALERILQDPQQRSATQYHDAFAGLSRGDEKALWDSINATEGFVESCPHFDYVPDMLGALRYLAKDLVCITAVNDRSPYWGYERARWLEKRGFDRKHRVFTADKSRQDVSVFIDDHPEKVLAWHARYPDRLAVLWCDPSFAPIEDPQPYVFVATSSEQLLAHLTLWPSLRTG